MVYISYHTFAKKKGGPFVIDPTLKSRTKGPHFKRRMFQLCYKQIFIKAHYTFLCSAYYINPAKLFRKRNKKKKIVIN